MQEKKEEMKENPTIEEQMSSSPEKEFRLPSGLVVIGRKFKPKHRDLWNDQKKRQNDCISDILDDCTVRVVDPGPYAKATYKEAGTGRQRPIFSDGKLDWRHALTGDRYDFLRQNSISTYGPFRDLDVTCGCGRDQVLRVDLRELSVTPLSDAACEAFESGEGVTFVLPESRKTVKFGFSTGQLERNLMAMSQNGQLDRGVETMALSTRIKSIEGVDQSRIQRFLAEDIYDDEYELLQLEMESVECGIDFWIEGYCKGPTCGAKIERLFPFDQLLASSQAMKEKRRQRRRGVSPIQV